MIVCLLNLSSSDSVLLMSPTSIVFPSRGFTRLMRQMLTNFADHALGAHVLPNSNHRINISLPIVPLISKLFQSLSLITFFRLNTIWSDRNIVAPAPPPIQLYIL